MGQKTHPIGIRLGITQNSISSWYAKNSDYAFFVREDKYLRDYILTHYYQCIISEIKIVRRRISILLYISATRVRPLVGTKGRLLEKLCYKIQKKCQLFRKKYFNTPKASSKSDENPEMQIFVRQLIRPEIQAKCLRDFIITELEKRVPFRRVLRLTQDRAQNLGQIRGLRIQISGRLNGADIARTEWVRIGRVPLQILSADLDYSNKTASTIYGLLGVKVWLFC